MAAHGYCRHGPARLCGPRSVFPESQLRLWQDRQFLAQRELVHIQERAGDQGWRHDGWSRQRALARPRSSRFLAVATPRGAALVSAGWLPTAGAADSAAKKRNIMKQGEVYFADFPEVGR